MVMKKEGCAARPWALQYAALAIFRDADKLSEGWVY